MFDDAADNILPFAKPPSSCGPDPDADPAGCSIVPRKTGRSLLTPEQRQAVTEIDRFIADPARRLFVLHGPSGSGKSRIRATFDVWTRFKNLRTATAGVMAGREAEVPSAGRMALEKGRWLKNEVVVLDDAGTARHADIAVLRRCGARIVALVDPDRLPPVHGSDPAFQRADFTLTEIHPTALADPIRTQARAVLAGGDYHDDGDAVRVKAAGSKDDLVNASIVLCAQDATRKRLNQLTRKARGHIAGPVPADGSFDPIVDHPRVDEMVVVLRSDELARGEIAWLWEKPFKPGDTNTILLIGDGNGGLAELSRVRFAGMPSRLHERAVLNELDFAYAMPVSDIQGARWRRVLVIDELPRDDPNRPRWLFTAFCAAEQTITIIRKHC